MARHLQRRRASSVAWAHRGVSNEGAMHQLWCNWDLAALPQTTVRAVDRTKALLPGLLQSLHASVASNPCHTTWPSSFDPSRLAEPKSHLKSSVLLATRQGNVARVEDLASAGAELCATDSGGRTALHWAALSGQQEIAAILLQNGADVHATDSCGRTALYLAAARGHSVLARLLLEHGADIHARDADGVSILQRAEERGRDEIMALAREHHTAHADAEGGSGHLANSSNHRAQSIFQ